VDARLLIGSAIVAAFLIFAAARFAMSWMRSSPEERKRWSHRGRHDDGHNGVTFTYARWRGRHRGR
jgi:hypothetical protein